MAGHRSSQVWIGTDETSIYGCGVIVDARHVVTCAHVVRSIYDLPVTGTRSDDLKGKAVWITYRDKDIAMDVLAIEPLRPERDDQTPFDDICILQRKDAERFPPELIAHLLTEEQLDNTLRQQRANFVGTGVVYTDDASDLPNQFMPEAFRGEITVRSPQIHWYSFHSQDAASDVSRGCSGAGVHHPSTPESIFGIVHGQLKPVQGLLIPSYLIGSYLEAHTLMPTWAKQRAERATIFRPVAKKTPSGIKEEALAECDRQPQKLRFQALKTDFVKNDRKLLFAAIKGKRDDLPALSNRKFSRESITAYWDWARSVVKEKVADSASKRYPLMDIWIEDPTPITTEDDVWNLFTQASSPSAALEISIGHPNVIIDALDKVDAPVVIIVSCPAAAYNADVLALWHRCASIIAAGRRKRPIVTLFFIDCTDCDAPELPEKPEFGVLPTLQKLAQPDVETWASKHLGLNDKDRAALLAKLGSDQFTLAELRKWLFEPA